MASLNMWCILPGSGWPLFIYSSFIFLLSRPNNIALIEKQNPEMCVIVAPGNRGRLKNSCLKNNAAVASRNKEANLTSAPRPTEQRNCIHKAEKWTTAGGVAPSCLPGSHERARTGPGCVSVLFWTLVQACLADSDWWEKTGATDVITAADNRGSKLWLFIFCESVHVPVCSPSANCSHTHTHT